MILVVHIPDELADAVAHAAAEAETTPAEWAARLVCAQARRVAAGLQLDLDRAPPVPTADLDQRRALAARAIGVLAADDVPDGGLAAREVARRLGLATDVERQRVTEALADLAEVGSVVRLGQKGRYVRWRIR